MNRVDLEAMNRRIADRWAKTNDYPAVLIEPPKWADRVVDAGDELIALHRETGAPDELPLRDLEPGAQALVVARRLIERGATAVEVETFLRVYEMPQYERDGLIRELRMAAGSW